MTVKEEERRTKTYQVAERLYNIYYLMRRRGEASWRVKAVVNFMLQFYRPEELVAVTRIIAKEACGLNDEARLDHYLAYQTILENQRDWQICKRFLRRLLWNFLSFPIYQYQFEGWRNLKKLRNKLLTFLMKD